MGKNKKIYSQRENEEIVEKLKEEYEEQLQKQKDRIFELVEDNERLKKSVDVYAKKDKLVSKAIESAIEKAAEIEESARLKYKLEAERLRDFQDKWQEYYKEVIKRYPVDERIENIEKFVKGVDKILGEEDLDRTVSLMPKEAEIDALDMPANAGEVFDPKSKIEKMVKRESEEPVFDMDAVLNPKEELDLEKLLEELGID